MRELLNVYVTNLGKYNEGQLIGEWLKLPASEEEIQDCFYRIGLNEEYEEYFITDYESEVGLKCSEYSNLSKLNEKIQELEDATNGEYEKLKALIERDYFKEEDLEQIIEEVANEDIYFYKGIDGEEYEEQYVADCYNINFDNLGWLSDYITIDYEAMVKDDDSIYETEDGVLVDRS